MNNLIKYIFLILTIMVNNDSYSQGQNYLKTIRIELRNSIGENIENAKILIDSVEIKYDTLTKGYFGSGQFSNDFTIEVICEGYEDLTYNKKDLPFGQNSIDFVARLHLSKPGDKYYYYTPNFRVPYQPHPNELLVVLKTKESIISENSISEFENSIKKQGLIVSRTFLEMPSSDSKEYMKYSSVNPSIRKQVIVKKEDGSAFDAASSTELAFLRQLEHVEYAGPLILMSTSYYDAFTYDHFIRMDYPLKSIDGATLTKHLKAIDERYFFDEKNYRIVLPPETNENVPQIMEKIIESGISELLYMSVMKFKKKQSNIDPKTISQLNSSDTLKHDSFIYGGGEVTYNKDWDRIGVLFESNYSDYSTFTSKYKLKADNQNQYYHQNFTVFQFTESLSIEERRKVIETIRKEKYVSIVGDLLYGDSNSAPTIIPEEIIVRWKRETTDSDRINKFIEEEGLEEISKQKSLNITILKVQNPYNYRVIKVCNKLVDSGLATFAEPNFDLQVIEGPTYK